MGRGRIPEVDPGGEVADAFSRARPYVNTCTTPTVASAVRPYAMTAGRSVPRMEVAMDALVSSVAMSAVDLSLMSPEYHDICLLCRHVRSVAEIASYLGIPLSVTRIIVADMAAEGLVHVYEPKNGDDPLDRRLLEKVLRGLNKL
ncbi:DUF742 domain-containing protein [Thermocatellispora tengchongensis]|nr:DUF742 domain-containing protein [Thermocatellispora tengchongensis]